MKRERGLRRLVKRFGGSLHTRGFILWAAALATGILCVWQHVYSMRLASDIQALRDRRETVQAEIGFLRIACAELSSRERVEAYAQERLGMRYPEAHEVRRLAAERPQDEARADEFVGREDDGVQDG